MGKYTVYNHPWIDQQIQEHLDFAQEKITQKIDNIVSIILLGGFGRGEGSVKFENRKMIPVNDYDIYVILDGNLKISELIKQELIKEIEKEVGTSGFSLYEKSEKSFYFDIRFLNLNQLSKLPPFIKYYEIKHASYILSGRDVRNLIPDYNSKDLPISEGLRFMLNRLSSISLCGPVDLFSKKELMQWHKDTLLYDISKSYIEMATCLTQLAGVYKPTYQERLIELRNVFDQNFIELKNSNPDLLEKIGYYTELKLRPEYDKIDNYLDRWFETRDDLFMVINFVLKSVFFINDFDQFISGASKRYFKPYLQIILKNRFGIGRNKIILLIANFFAQSYLSIIWFLRIYRLKKRFYFPILFDLRDPGIKIYDSLLFLMSCINKEKEINSDMFKKGAKLLQKIYPVEMPSIVDLNSFQKIIDSYINAWKLYFFQEIG